MTCKRSNNRKQIYRSASQAGPRQSATTSPPPVAPRNRRSLFTRASGVGPESREPVCNRTLRGDVGRSDWWAVLVYSRHTQLPPSRQLNHLSFCTFWADEYKTISKYFPSFQLNVKRLSGICALWWLWYRVALEESLAWEP